MAGSDANDWELSKENIQPLKKGRNIATLIAALDESKHANLNIQKMEFEKQIRTYSGDDPLQVWYQYVHWMEQNYPKGGKEGSTGKLIESCFAFINENSWIDKYKNDLRFLDLWIKYAEQCPYPIEVYNLIFNQNICTTFPILYENWAYQYEKCKNYKKADEVYEKGFAQQDLESREQLKTFQKYFQMRVAKTVAQSMQDEGEPPQAVEDTRCIGNHLRTKEALANVKAPIERVGISVLGTAGNIRSEKVGNEALPAFNIFKDENEIYKTTNASGSGAIQLPSSHDQSKENVKKASKWSKLGSRPKEAIAVSALPDINSLNFPVYTDPDADNDHNKMKPIVTGALAEKKPEVAWKPPLFAAEPTEEKSRPMYCKSRVYCGTEEFSFEELRSMDLFKRQKMAGAETGSTLEAAVSQTSVTDSPVFVVEPYDPTHQPQYCKDKVYCNNEEFSFEEIRARKVFAEQAKNKEEMKLRDEIEDLKKMLKQQQEIIDTLKKKENSDSQISIQDNSSTSVGTISLQEKEEVHPPCPAKAISVQRMPAYEDSWMAINKSVAEPNETNWLEESTQGLLMVASPDPIPLPPELRLEITAPIMATPLKSQRQQVDNLSMRAVEASPTINTKMANHLVAELFNLTLSTSVYPKESTPEEEYENIESPIEEPFEIYHDSVPSARKSVPFTIYQDENAHSHKQSDQKWVRKPLMVLTEVPVHLPKQEQIYSVTDEDSREDQENNAPRACSPVEAAVANPQRMQAALLEESIAPLEEQKSPPAIEDGDKENGDVVLDASQVKRPLSGILQASQDISVEEPMEEWEIPLETKVEPRLGAEEGKCGLPEDFTIRLPNSGRDFAKMASIASTPNPWSFGVVPQKDVEDDFTLMKAPAVVASKPHLSVRKVASRIPTLMVTSPVDNNMAIESEFKSPLLPGANDRSAIVNAATPTCSVQSKVLSEQHSDLPESEVRKCETNLEDDFDPDKVAAMLWDMDPIYDPDVIEANTDDRHQTEHPLLATKVSYPHIIDPFCSDLRSLLLSNLKDPLQNRGGFVAMHIKFPTVKPNSKLVLGKESYRIRYLRGKGSYAQVYQAFTENSMDVTFNQAADPSGSQMALKVQTPACYWEFYICHEIRRRLKEKQVSRHVIDSIMRVNRAYFFKQGSIFVTDYHSHGSLLSLTNGYKIAGKPVPQSLALYVMIELLTILGALHSCGIIHGDLKPDNVLIQRIPSECPLGARPPSADGPLLLKLIDFGRSIDLQLLPKGSTFVKKINTDGFTCCEMRDGRPWTYQMDYYGLASIAHCLLWGSYMNVKKRDQTWTVSGVTMQRHWNKELWSNYFDQLLNAESCHSLVDLKILRDQFLDAFNADYRPSAITDSAFVIA